MRIFILLFLWVGVVQAEEAEDRLNKALVSLNSFQAEFKQVVLDDHKKVVQQSSGKVSISRPGKFAWIYQHPYEQQIIADGKELWVYDVDLDQATVKPMSSGLATAPIMVLMNDENVADAFEINAIGQRKELYWIELTPKTQDMEFSTIHIGMKDSVIKAMQLSDRFGQATQITFDNLRTDMIFDPKTFIFEAPPGVDVFGAGVAEG